MKTALFTLLFAGGLGMGFVVSTPSPAAADATTMVLKCPDCEGRRCTMVYGSGSASCTLYPEGCISEGICGE